MDQALRLADLKALAALGLDTSTFGRLSWQSILVNLQLKLP
jgi:hypothetical protein